MRLLLLGRNGQLGWEIIRMAKARNIECLGVDRSQLDVTDQAAVEKTTSRGGFPVVINATGYTAVDKAELERDAAFAVNFLGPSYLAQSCAKLNIPVVHISTDYVFDGLKKSPYLESDPISPVSAYGESKAAGEEAVRRALRSHIILRSSWLYSAHGNNFVKTIIRLAREQEELRVVNDQYGCPTYAGDLAEAILDITGQILRSRPISWGTYHYCGQGVVSRYDFAQKICEIAKNYVPLRVKEIKAVSTAEYPAAARRPPYSALDCRKIGEAIGVKFRNWQDSLTEFLARFFQENYPGEKCVNERHARDQP